MDKDTKDLLWKYSEKVQELQRENNKLKDEVGKLNTKIEFLEFQNSLYNNLVKFLEDK